MMIFLTSSSMCSAVFSLKFLFTARSRPRKMRSSCSPKVSGPSSDMPHWQTILRAISVAFSKSLAAPVVVLFRNIISATRPAMSTESWASR